MKQGQQTHDDITGATGERPGGEAPEGPTGATGPWSREPGGADPGAERRPATMRCAWCRRRLPPPAATGRPRRFCRPACRQRAFEARRRLDDLTWAEDQLRAVRDRADAAELALVAVADVLGELRARAEDREGGTSVSEGWAMALEVLERLEAIVRPWSRTDRT